MPYKKVGSLWIRESNNGKKYLSGVIKLDEKLFYKLEEADVAARVEEMKAGLGGEGEEGEG